MDSVLITGASGLLGSEVVKQLIDKDLFVLGQYYKNKPSYLKNSKWIYGNFVNLNSIKQFIDLNKDEIKKCVYFVNCYGPITYKSVKDLKTKNFENDYFSNVLVPIEIINFFLKQEKPILKSIMNIGFELSGKIKPVKKVLPYIMAKNALLQYSISLAHIYENINFNMVSPITIDGAKVPSKNGNTVSPNMVAQTIIKTLLGNKSGKNLIVT